MHVINQYTCNYMYFTFCDMFGILERFTGADPKNDETDDISDLFDSFFFKGEDPLELVLLSDEEFVE